MEERRIKRAVEVVEKLLEEFKELHCEEGCSTKERGDCSQSDSEVVECIVEIIVVNDEVIEGLSKKVLELCKKK